MTVAHHDLLEISQNATFVERLHARAQQQPQRLAFVFLADGETESHRISYADLDRRSRAIAADLQARGLQGKRALLLYPPGIEYIAGFFGCLYAGVVAVPAYPPRKRQASRIWSIVSDAGAAIALTSSEQLANIRSRMQEDAEKNALQWLATDTLPEDAASTWQPPIQNPEAIAFLQYTSGSTGNPKGVIVTHNNLIHNSDAIYQFMGHSPDSIYVSWLPMYHDMGLIGVILQSIYGGFRCVVMPPASFLQRPYRWLKAISDYRGTTSGAPNFAFDLCVRHISEKQRATLDLSCWQVAFNGSEPVRANTLEQFARTFSCCGLRREALYPCYGMAEATLMVSGDRLGVAPVTATVAAGALEQKRVVFADAGTSDARTLVGCGWSIPEQTIAIVSPETRTRCESQTVGEIWVSGPSVGSGYWQQTEATQETFRAYLADTGEGPFLRTGDLGFLHQGNLFITGRLKDTIVLRGRTLYPQDIEETVERSHPSLRTDSGAAFAVEAAGEEQLAVVQELGLREKPDTEEVIRSIREAIAREWDIRAYAIVLVRGGTIPKTSSGKIQRRACRQQFLNDELTVRASSFLEWSDLEADELTIDPQELLGLSPEERFSKMLSILQQEVARALKLPQASVSTELSLTSLGLDSLTAFDIKSRIGDRFGVTLSVEELFQDANLRQLAERAVVRLNRGNAQQVPLQLVPRTKDLPASPAQRRLWFLQQLEPSDPFYNVPVAIHITGKFDPELLQCSLNEIVRRHEILRTCFRCPDGEPVQVIEDLVSVDLPVVEIPSGTMEDALHHLTQQNQQPFDLTRVPLVRFQLLRLAPQEHVLAVVAHHIVIDGWSVGVLLQELGTLYDAYRRHQPSPLEPLTIQYADFASWYWDWLQSEDCQRQLDYWKQQLHRCPPLLPLPLDGERSQKTSYAGKKAFFAYPRSLQESIRDLSRQAGGTTFMTLLAAFDILLYHYSHQEDIVVGIPTAGRSHVQTQQAIGFFVNTLVLRTPIAEHLSCHELLERKRDIAVGAYAHQDLPFDKLVEHLQPERDPRYNPIFQVMFIFQNAPMEAVDLKDVSFRVVEADSGTSKLDWKLSITETSEGLRGSLEYKTDLFRATTIEEAIANYEIVLQQMVQNPQQSVGELLQHLQVAVREQRQQQAQNLEATSLQKLKKIKRTHNAEEQA